MVKRVYEQYQRASREANAIELRLQRGGTQLGPAERELLTRLVSDLRGEAEAKRQAWLESVQAKTS